MTLKEDLQQFIGTTAYHRLTYYPIYCTDGVAFFANKTESYWLVDEIGHHVTHPLKDQPFVYIVVKSKDNKADIRFEDGNKKHLLTKHIPFTDLPEGEWKFFYADRVLMLPSEY